jgi:hypothetical protein
MAEKSNTEEVQTPDPELSADELVASLVDSEEPEVVAETPTEEAPAETVEESQPEAEATEEPAAETTEVVEPEAETPPAETPAPVTPGTPNKVLQAAQQDLSAVNRKIDALMAKIEEQGRATPQQVQQVETLKAKADEAADEIAALANATPDTVDSFDGTIKVAKRIVSHGQTLESHDQRFNAIEAKLFDAEQRANLAELQAAHGDKWKPVWAQAQAEIEELGITPDDPKFHNAANTLFHKKLKATAVTTPVTPVAKPASTTSPKAPIKPAPTTARKAPPTTPGGTRVTPSSGAIKSPVPVSDESYMESLAARLVD